MFCKRSLTADGTFEASIFCAHAESVIPAAIAYILIVFMFFIFAKFNYHTNLYSEFEVNLSKDAFLSCYHFDC